MFIPCIVCVSSLYRQVTKLMKKFNLAVDKPQESPAFEKNKNVAVYTGCLLSTFTDFKGMKTLNKNTYHQLICLTMLVPRS